VTSAVDISEVRTQPCMRMLFLVPTSSNDVLACSQVYLRDPLVRLPLGEWNEVFKWVHDPWLSSCAPQFG